MLQGFWGGVILAVVNQAIVFLVLGALACAILIVRVVAARMEPPVAKVSPAPPAVRPPAPPARLPKTRVAAVMAAVHAFSGTPPGSLRIVRLARLGGESSWKAAGRIEALGGERDAGGRNR